MSLWFSSSFEEVSILINCIATFSAMLDWTLDPNPASFLSPGPGADGQTAAAPSTHDSSHVPIILRYALQSLATLKPPSIDDLIHEAAVEFHLDPRSIYLAISINQCPVKISLSLYRRIAPLSTIYVQHHTPSPIFNPLPSGGHSAEPLSAPDASASNSTTNTSSALTATTAATSNGQTSNSRQAIHDFLNRFATVSTVENAPPQPAPVNDSSSAVENPTNGTSPPAIVSLLSSSIPPNGLDNSQPSPSTGPAGPNDIMTGAFANNPTNQQNLPTTGSRTSKKRFLINSLASANTLNHPHPSHHPQQQQRLSLGQEQDPSGQTRRSKFPFLANRRQSSAGSPSSSSTLNPSSAISIADSPSDHSPRFSANGPPSGHDPSHDLFSLDLFNSLSSSSSSS